MYLTGLAVDNVGSAVNTPKGLYCPVTIEWTYGTQLPDVVEIYVGSTDVRLAADVYTFNVGGDRTRHKGTLYVQAGLTLGVNLYACPRLQVSGEDLGEMPDDQGVEQPFENYCLVVVVATPAVPQPPSATLPTPVIQSLQVQQGQVLVAWTSPRPYDKFIVYWGLKGGGPSESQQSYDLPGGSNGTYVAKPTFDNLTYTFAVDGCVDGVFNSDCSGWGKTEEVTIPAGMGALAAPVLALTAQVISPREVMLNWHNAQAYSKILVRRTPGPPGLLAEEWTLAGNATSFDDTERLSPGTSYRYDLTVWANVYGPSSTGVDVVTSRLPLALPRHSSNFLQSNYGTQGNYELLVPQGGNSVGHYWRNNDDPNYNWHGAPALSFAGESYGTQFLPGRTPQGVALLQSTIAGDGVHGNFELVVWASPALAGPDKGSLLFFSFNTATSKWESKGPIVADGQPITGVTGAPALIQSSFGGWGNYELLVPQGNSVGHYWRNNDDPGYNWHGAPGLSLAGEGHGTQFMPASTPQGVALLQSTIAGDGVHGNFELVVWVTQALGGLDTGGLLFFGFNTATSKWEAKGPIVADGQPITGVTGTPAFIQSNYGTQGNYELLVPQGNSVGHYWRNNDDPNYSWHGAPALSFAGQSHGNQFLPGRTPQGIALLQSTIAGDGVHGNFDLVVWASQALIGADQGSLLFFGFNTATSKWEAKGPIVADGQPITGVTAF